MRWGTSAKTHSLLRNGKDRADMNRIKEIDIELGTMNVRHTTRRTIQPIVRVKYAALAKCGE